MREKTMINYVGWIVFVWLSMGCKNETPKTIPSVPRKSLPMGDYIEKERVIWQKPDMVINTFGDLANKTVADLGAGTGFFTFRLLDKCKKVIALEIDKRFIAFIDSTRATLPPLLREKLETRLVEANNPKLQPQEVDNILIVNTYMYINNRVAYLKTLKKGMKPNGRILIVDYKEKNIPEGPKPELKVPLSVVERELVQAGLKIVKSDDTSLEYQYIITAVHQ